MPPSLRLLLAAMLGLAACPAPWDPLVTCEEFDACDTTAPASTTDDTLPTTSLGSGVQTVTSDTGGDSTTSPATDTSDSTGQPAEPPSIVDFKLTPNPITTNGPITVTVTAEHATGVRMDTGLGDIIELTPQPEPGTFTGEIAILTGLQNGPHAALLTPWDNTLDGPTMAAPYQIALPKPGSEQLWETGDLIGPGRIVAIATLPSGELVELGHHSPEGEQRCYLRLRDKAGLWAPADIVDVLPDTPCEAVDLQLDDEGALFVLVHQQTNNELFWRLLQLPAWGQSAKHMGLGAKKEVAVALAHHDSGMVAVCGTAPTGQMDEIDALAHLFRPGLTGEPWRVDHEPLMKDPHQFAEHPRDCVFIGDTLTLVGEANGFHELELIKRDRLFVLRLDTKTKTTAWTVPPPGDKLQSGAQAIAVDDEQHLVVAGYTCDDACAPVGDLRILDERDTLVWQASLGGFPTKQFAVQDLAWSPAGYAVVATGGLKGNESAFTVRAFSTAQEEALWTFTRKDLQVLHFALALAIGEYGEIYAGGYGANGYPAIAYIAG